MRAAVDTGNVDLLSPQHPLVDSVRERQRLAASNTLASRHVGARLRPAETDNGMTAEIRDQEAHRAGSDHHRQLVGDHLDRCGRRGGLHALQQRPEIGTRKLLITHELNPRVPGDNPPAYGDSEPVADQATVGPVTQQQGTHAVGPAALLLQHVLGHPRRTDRVLAIPRELPPNSLRTATSRRGSRPASARRFTRVNRCGQLPARRGTQDRIRRVRGVPCSRGRGCPRTRSVLEWCPARGDAVEYAVKSPQVLVGGDIAGDEVGRCGDAGIVLGRCRRDGAAPPGDPF